jgi:cytolysin (calcineurin-like family phosphatase)
MTTRTCRITMLSISTIASLVGLDVEAANVGEPLDVTFFVTSDMHVCTVRDGVSPTVARNHVRAMNTATSDSAYGRKVWPEGLPSAGQRIKDPAGLVITGDWAMDRAPIVRRPSEHPEWGDCWELFLDLYSGPQFRNKPHSIRFPVFPGFGNHDWDPASWNYTLYGAQNGVIKANYIRDVTAPSGRSIHWPPSGCPPPPFSWGQSAPPPYAWSWGKLRLVNLHTFAGEPGRCVTVGKGYWYNTGAYEWLERDLAAHAAAFGPDAPVVIFQHYGYDNDSLGQAGDGWDGWWWSPPHRAKLESILNRYNVIVLFSGHNHAVGSRTFGGLRKFLNVSTGNGGENGGFWAVHVTDANVEMAYLNKVNEADGNGETTTNDHPEYALSRVIAPAGVLPLRTGDRIALRGDNGKFLSRINRGAGIDPIEAAKTDLDVFSAFSVVDLGRGKIALRADNGKFLSRIYRGSAQAIEAAKDTQDPFTPFQVTELAPGQIALQADTGMYWSRVRRGADGIEAASDAHSSFATFTLTLLERPNSSP